MNGTLYHKGKPLGAFEAPHHGAECRYVIACQQDGTPVLFVRDGMTLRFDAAEPSQCCVLNYAQRQ